MAPRSTARVKIVSPNSGDVTLSRSASAHSTRSHGTNGSAVARSANSSTYGSPAFTRQPLAAINSNANYASSTGKVVAGGRAGDQEAIQRAQDALAAAGRNVLRKPFGGHTSGANNSGTKSTNTAFASAGSAQSLRPRNGASTAPAHGVSGADHGPSSAMGGDGKNRSMQLPPSILGLYHRRSASRSSTFAPSSRGSSLSSKRPRSASAEDGNPFRRLGLRGEPLLPRSGRTVAAQTCAVARADVSSGETTTAVQAPPPQRVCPAMFSGISAIPLSEKLFDEVTDTSRHANYYPGPGAEVGRGGKTEDAAGSTDVCPRRCVMPLWSLVGTFKTALTSVVNVDYGNDCLNWQQRNPKGGFQRIRVPLHAVLDAAVARVTQEDEDIKERQFTVIVRTSARPSQVVFGFRTTREANEFRNMARPKGM